MSHRCDLAVTIPIHHDLVIRNYTPHPIFPPPRALSPDERRRLGLAPHEAVRIVPSTRYGADAVDVYADGVYVGFLVREMEVSHG